LQNQQDSSSDNDSGGGRHRFQGACGPGTRENYDYDWLGAEKEFRRALELDPQYASAHQWYAEFLSWQGRFPEAFAESEQARQLDPISLIGATDRASILYESRQYDSALKQWRSVLDLDPTYDHAEHMMIPAYLQLGRYDDAVKVIDRWEAVGDGPWMWSWKAAVYARAGHPDEARRALAKLEQSSGSPANRAVTLLIAYSGTGEKERPSNCSNKCMRSIRTRSCRSKWTRCLTRCAAIPGSRICCCA
jgi:tetratricopeptide (TPR) repeat protein